MTAARTVEYHFPAYRSGLLRGGVAAMAQAALALGLIGCGNIVTFTTAPLLSTPLKINGEDIGEAIVDTGGAYELMLRERFGLEIIDTVDVLAFGGREEVGLTHGFEYEAGGVRATAEVALIGLSACDCNGLGFFFFRKTGTRLHLDFSRLAVEFGVDPPAGGVELPFEPPPEFLANFDSAFLTVDVSAGEESRQIVALLDTGTNATLMRRGLIGTPGPFSPNRLSVEVAHPLLGTVAVRATLFDTEGLPDMIIGTDVMRAWSNEWYFHFAPFGGTVVAFPGKAPAGTAKEGVP